MVWGGSGAIVDLPYWQNADASKDTTPDAILTVSGNGEGGRI